MNNSIGHGEANGAVESVLVRSRDNQTAAGAHHIDLGLLVGSVRAERPVAPQSGLV